MFDDVDQVTLEGMAFDDGIVRENAVCKFVFENGDEYCKSTKKLKSIQNLMVYFMIIICPVTQPSETVTFDTVVCPTPDVNYTVG